MSAYGTCPKCSLLVALLPGGVVQDHGTCPGAGQLPTEARP